MSQQWYVKTTWFSYGSTMNNGNPPQPIFDGSGLDNYLFMMPIIKSDFDICESLRIGGAPLQLLWVTPITSAERELIIDQGMEAFLGLLEKHRHSLLLEPQRKCYTRRKGWFGG